MLPYVTVSGATMLLFRMAVNVDTAICKASRCSSTSVPNAEKAQAFNLSCFRDGGSDGRDPSLFPPADND